MERLSANASHWIRLNSAYLDSTAARAELPVTPRMKALLQLALLRRFWARVRPEDPGLREVTAVVERVWRGPDFTRLIDADPASARQYGLMYGALAPEGLTEGPHRAVLARLAADGYLAPRAKSPYLRLETRYHADLAGVSHRIEPYRDLYESSLLARCSDATPAAALDACNVTHTLFYLGDFGFGDPGLTGDERERALAVVCRLTDRCVARDEWELAGKLVLAQFCLGADPARTPSGAAGLALLARVQLPGGAIPGRSPADRAEESTTTVEFFRKVYQATLVTALASLIISATYS